MPQRNPTPLEWVASSLADLKRFPADVQRVMGFALYLAETGGKHPDAKPLTGDPAFRGAGVIEIIDDYDGDTYQAVYTVRFAGVIYVLDAFQKKARKISRPRKLISIGSRDA